MDDVLWVSILLCVFECFSFVGLLIFTKGLGSGVTHATPKTYAPRTAVFLPIRGADPGIRETLVGLARQEYPDFSVFLMVDHAEDASLPVVREIAEELDPTGEILRVTIRHELYENASLKCASLVQLIREIDPSYELIAGIDADVKPHATWLRELVAPLADPDISGSSGYRWYQPARPTWGALMRYLFNAVSWIWVTWGHVFWGGSYVIRRNVLQKPEMLDALRNSLVEDNLFTYFFQKHKLHMVRVSGMLMQNDETCDVAFFYRWVQRQMFWHRIFLPVNWILAIFMCVGMSAAFGFLGYKLFLGQWLALAGITVCWFANGLMIAILQRAAESSLSSCRTDPLPCVPFWRIFLVIPFTIVVFTVALIRTIFVQTISWREIRYKLVSTHFRMVEYRPYRITTHESSLE